MTLTSGCACDVAWLPVPDVVESVAGPLPAGVQAAAAVVLVVDNRDALAG